MFYMFRYEYDAERVALTLDGPLTNLLSRLVFFLLSNFSV